MDTWTTPGCLVSPLHGYQGSMEAQCDTIFCIKVKVHQLFCIFYTCLTGDRTINSAYALKSKIVTPFVLDRWEIVEMVIASVTIHNRRTAHFLCVIALHMHRLLCMRLCVQITTAYAVVNSTGIFACILTQTKVNYPHRMLEMWEQKKTNKKISMRYHLYLKRYESGLSFCDRQTDGRMSFRER